MRITQCHISSSLSFFGSEFMRKWGFVPYTDKEAPAFFFGCYKPADVDLINAHQGFSLYMFGGEDLNNAAKLRRTKFVMTNFDYYNRAKALGINKPDKFIDKPIAVKDYSSFEPLPLGDKIYIYLGVQSMASRERYGFDIYSQLQQRYGRQLITGIQGHSHAYVHEMYYKEAFINIQLNPQAGFTSALEMAHMGRRTISQRKEPFCIPYNSFDDICKAIDDEALKVGTIAYDVAEAARTGITNDDDWLYTDYWE